MAMVLTLSGTIKLRRACPLVRECIVALAVHRVRLLANVADFAALAEIV
jgi:hypothetical protein